MKFFKEFISSRTVPYYIGLGVARVAFDGGIVCGAGLSFAGPAFIATILTLIGFLVYVGVPLLGYDRAAASVSAGCTFAAFVALICSVYEHFLTEVQNQAMGGFDIGAVKGFYLLIASAVILLVAAIAGNVFVWLPLRKKPAAQPAAA